MLKLWLMLQGKVNRGVGTLCTKLVLFHFCISTFSTSRPTENVHSQRNRLVFLQPEPGFWMHMCVELGIQRRQIKDAKGKEKLVTEYSDTELNDQALSALLCIGYEQFKVGCAYEQGK